MFVNIRAWVLELNTKCKAYFFVIRLFLGLQTRFFLVYIQILYLLYI